MAIKTVGNLIPSTTDTPLDARIRINTISEIELIENPYIGMTFFVIENNTYYIVKSLKSKELNGQSVENALIDEFEVLPSSSQVLSMIKDNETTYTINGKIADDNGNFTISADDIDGAQADHIHQISQINNLSSELDSKAPSDHTHQMVKSITIGDNILSDSLVFEGSKNVIIENVGNVISIIGEPFVEDIADQIPNANPSITKPIKMFVGTQSEWDSFEKETDVDYVVFIVD